MATITLPVMDIKGSEVEKIDLNDALLEREKGEQAVHDAVVAFLAKNRAGTACAKTRGQVKGTGSKPFRQKGTGRARSGSVKSPIWRGGGVVFGPSPRSYAKKINRKVSQLAVRRTFTERVDAGDVIVVDDIKLDAPKTREMAAFLKNVGAGESVLVIVDSFVDDVMIASYNMPDVLVMKASSVNAYWTLLFKKIVITKAGLEVLTERVGQEENE